jgi:hypothetical protein
VFYQDGRALIIRHKWHLLNGNFQENTIATDAYRDVGGSNITLKKRERMMIRVLNQSG